MNDNRFVENIKAYAFLFPFLLVFVVFLGYPIVYSMVLSVHEVPAYSDWYNVIGDMEYVGGKHYFNLKATNGQIIGTSELYEATSGMENGIASVKTNAPKAPVEEV